MKNEIMNKEDEGFMDLFEPLFGDFFKVNQMPKEFTKMNNMMKTDVKENENGYVLDVDMPGFDKKDVNLSIKDGYLTISAEKKENDEEKGHKFIRRERYYGSCSRSFYVGDVKEQDVNAKLNNGILTISLPKDKKEDKHIEIQ